MRTASFPKKAPRLPLLGGGVVSVELTPLLRVPLLVHRRNPKTEPTGELDLVQEGGIAELLVGGGGGRGARHHRRGRCNSVRLAHGADVHPPTVRNEGRYGAPCQL